MENNAAILTLPEAEALATEYGCWAAQRDDIIRRCRSAGLSAPKVAKLMGLSRQYVYNLQARDQRRQELRNSPGYLRSVDLGRGPITDPGVLRALADRASAGDRDTMPLFRSWCCSGCGSPLATQTVQGRLYCDDCSPLGGGS